MFKERLLSGIILVILIVATLYCGGYITLGVVAAISIIGGRELIRVKQTENKAMHYVLAAGIVVYYGLLFAGLSINTIMAPMLVGFLMVLLGFYVFGYPRFELADIMLPFFGLMYVACMLSFIALVRNAEHGAIWVVLVFLSAWGNDTLAYCAGKLLGKHKMSPKLSPKKSWEGFFGGVLGAALLGLLYGVLIQQMNWIPKEDFGGCLMLALICGVAGAISVVGDLAASAIKRQFGIKDYGKLIPGHGGILDRFDSIILTAPIVYYLVLWLM